MEDLLKKFLYTGVGVVSLTLNKVQGSVDELISDNKISEEEGKKIVDGIIENTDAKKTEFESKLKAIAEEAVSNFRIPGTSRYEDMIKRIEAIESKLGITSEEVKTLEIEAPKKTTVAKKTTVKTKA